MATRCDSWAGRLTLDEQVKIYRHWTRTGARWDLVAAWIAEEFPEAEKPSRTALYAWRDRFAPEYARWNLDQNKAAADLMTEYAAGHSISDDDAVKALKAIAMRAYAAEDGKTAAQAIESAMALVDRRQRAAEIELKKAAQSTKDDQLRLARDKFEFDAAKKAMELAAEIKTIAADDALDDDEKIQKVREALFG